METCGTRLWKVKQRNNWRLSDVDVLKSVQGTAQLRSNNEGVKFSSSQHHSHKTWLVTVKYAKCQQSQMFNGIVKVFNETGYDSRSILGLPIPTLNDLNAKYYYCVHCSRKSTYFVPWSREVSFLLNKRMKSLESDVQLTWPFRLCEIGNHKIRLKHSVWKRFLNAEMAAFIKSRPSKIDFVKSLGGTIVTVNYEYRALTKDTSTGILTCTATPPLLYKLSPVTSPMLSACPVTLIFLGRQPFNSVMPCEITRSNTIPQPYQSRYKRQLFMNLGSPL